MHPIKEEMWLETDVCHLCRSQPRWRISDPRRLRSSSGVRIQEAAGLHVREASRPSHVHRYSISHLSTSQRAGAATRCDLRWVTAQSPDRQPCVCARLRTDRASHMACRQRPCVFLPSWGCSFPAIWHGADNALVDDASYMLSVEDTVTRMAKFLFMYKR